MLRQVVLDTETTGFKPEEGHRIVEIGAIELIDGVKTGKYYHQYIHPDRSIPEEVVKIHGITDEKVKNEPKFADIAEDFLTFIAGSELIIHNAEFDIKFLNFEIEKCNKGDLWKYARKATDTLKLSRQINATDKKHSLDALCEKYQIDNSHREFHGALLDSELLAEVYLKMTEGVSADDIEKEIEQTEWKRPPIKRYENLNLRVVKASPDEEEAHVKNLESVKDPIWNRTSSPKP